jgi:EAL domain-containing protein (putative c-di-GMP-specific phosphodiesterase class I)
MVGAEALIRWDDQDLGLRLPGEFLPLAERVGLMGPLSDWVIRTACEQASHWQASDLDLYVSLNLPPSYCDLSGMRRLMRTVDEFGLKPERLVVEITEAALMQTAWRKVEPALAELRRRGLRLAIDDFGTGHSSLGRLNRSWVSMLKVDRSFVSDLPASEDAGALVTSVLQLARNLGLEPIAEGIETGGQRRYLADRDCTIGQGFLFSRAVPPDEIEAMRHSAGPWVAASPRRRRATAGSAPNT